VFVYVDSSSDYILMLLHREFLLSPVHTTCVDGPCSWAMHEQHVVKIASVLKKITTRWAQLAPLNALRLKIIFFLFVYHHWLVAVLLYSTGARTGFSGPEVLLRLVCVAMKFVDDDDDERRDSEVTNICPLTL